MIKSRHMILLLSTSILIGIVMYWFSFGVQAVFDQDGDGVADSVDNCTLSYNQSQYDSNGDGIGNLCDQDITNDGIIDVLDLQAFNEFRKSNNPDADFNEDGSVDYLDKRILKSRLGEVPGPSGVAASLYDRPRLFTTNDKLADLSTKLDQYPYSKFWKNVRSLATRYANTIPPCPVSQPNCGARDSIADYEDETIGNLGDRIPYMVVAYRLTGESIYMDGVRTWMNAMVSYQDWGSNQDYGASSVLAGMSIAYDWLHQEFTLAERDAYRNKMQYHAGLLYEALVSGGIWWAHNYLQNHNYSVTMGLALTAIALYGELPEADEWLHEAHVNFDNVLLYLSPDGASHEGVAYWSTGMHALLQYTHAMDRFLPEIGKEMRESGYFQNAALYLLYSSLPDFRGHVDYADGWRICYRGPGHLLRALATVFSDGHAQWLAEKIESSNGIAGKPHHWLNLFWYSPGIAENDPYNLPTYRFFDNMGLLFARSSWDEGAFWSFHKSAPPQGYHAQALGRYPGSHIHPDEGQFLAWSQGSWLLIDDGYVALKRTENHNVIMFNNAGQLGSDAEWFKGGEVEQSGGTVLPEFSMLNDDGQYIVTDLAPIYRTGANLLSWKRSFVSLPEGYQLIRDDVQLNSPGTIESLVHSTTSSIPLDSSSIVLNPRDSVLEAYDRSGNGNNGILTGGTAVGGISGQALNLSGASDWVEFPSLHNVNFPANGTLSLWIKASDYAGQTNKSIFDSYDKERDHLFIRAYAGSTAFPLSGVQIAFQPGDGSSYQFFKSIDLPHNDWSHLTVTWDTNNDWGQIYLNGALVYENSINNSAWIPSDQLAIIGAGFSGSIDGVRLFDRVINSAEVLTLYGLGHVGANLIGYWAFDGIDDAVFPGYREDVYRLLYPPGLNISMTDYVIPKEEQHNVGNYYGNLLSATSVGQDELTLVHFLGNKNAHADYDSVNEIASIQHDGYTIIVDFSSRTIQRQ